MRSLVRQIAKNLRYRDKKKKETETVDNTYWVYKTLETIWRE